MICPFAAGCPGLEAFADQGQFHLAWAFCLGEYGDCDRYKAKLAAQDPTASSLDRSPVDKEAILSKLHANYRREPRGDR